MVLYKTQKSEFVRVDGGSDGQTLKKYSTSIMGDGVKSVFKIEHNLDTEDIIFEMHDGTEPCLVDYEVVDKNTVNITFAMAPTVTDKYEVKIFGMMEGNGNGGQGSGNIPTIDPSKVGTISTTNPDWDYTLDETSNIITLNYYKGSDVDVTVYSNYKINDETGGNSKIYKTQLSSKSNINNMAATYMFRNKKVQRVTFNDDLDTSTCTDMCGMFEGCSDLISLDLNNFDTSNVTYMDRMFKGCSSLTTLNLNTFDTSNVVSMGQMFEKCNSLISLGINNFNTSNVTNMYDMFRDCEVLKSLDVSKFNTSKVINMDSMFRGCNSLSSLNVSNFDTSNVVDMNNMFFGCHNLTSLDVRNFNTSKVTDMSAMFGCYSLTSLDISNFDTSNVTDMNWMFYNCANLQNINLGINFDTSNVTDMHRMFGCCDSLTSLNLSSFNTSKVTDMGNMFEYCRGLTSLDLNNFDTNNATNMAAMFSNCIKLTTIKVTRGKWETSQADTTDIFEGCGTSSVTYV